MSDSDSRRNPMQDALRLVRSGELRAATRVIQESLRRQPQLRPAHGATPTPTRALLEHDLDAAVAREAPSDAPYGTANIVECGRNTEAHARARAPAAIPDSLVTSRAGAPRPAIPFPRKARAFAPSTTPSRLDYRLALPVADGTARPLLIMLHGCQQDAADFARGNGMERSAVARGFIVVHPDQPSAANPSRCWNWFRPQDQRRDSGEPAAIMSVIDEVSARHPVDATRVYVAGLSAGAAMAVILAANYPERFAAVGAHSGLPYAAAGNVPAAFSAMRGNGMALPLPSPRDVRSAFVPLLVLHGDSDTTVAPRNADQLVTQWLSSAPGATEWQRDEATVPGVGRAARRTAWRGRDGRSMLEHWQIAGAGHAWSGGDAGGSYTDPAGPDASTILLDFFAQHARQQ